MKENKSNYEYCVPGGGIKAHDDEGHAGSLWQKRDAKCRVHGGYTAPACTAKAVSFCVSKEDCWRTSPKCFVSPRRGLKLQLLSHVSLGCIFPMPSTEGKSGRAGKLPLFPHQNACRNQQADIQAACRPQHTWNGCFASWILCSAVFLLP